MQRERQSRSGQPPNPCLGVSQLQGAGKRGLLAETQKSDWWDRAGWWPTRTPRMGLLLQPPSGGIEGREDKGGASVMRQELCLSLLPRCRAGSYGNVLEAPGAA